MLKMICLLVLLMAGAGVISTVEAVPREPEYSATISFPNGCLANGVLETRLKSPAVTRWVGG